ncbi:hypothetical protein PN471_01380 [Aphanizomenon sp. CS-733/32]|uniref:hypothetical protein n=1 Tax=Aphanizomenon sp. CS-733/32 TaxID=3021715 RepID=UPI00232CA803|nr:hypothetical protein [Aphanizomenon sp. CS-733/32]MDB9307330.1 hypothetical protein [Aphanizomenon sp. CS-733/32]
MSNHYSGNKLEVAKRFKRAAQILLLLGILSPVAVQAETNTICNDPKIIDDFSNAQNYHKYGHETLMCVTSYLKGCSKEFVFAMMTSNAAYLAPLPDNHEPVTNCMENTLAVVGGITTTVDNKNFTITNYTRTNHELYPGKVTRTVIQRGEGIYVSTVGEGDGKFPETNEVLGDNTFMLVDNLLQHNVLEKLCENQNCQPLDPPAGLPLRIIYPRAH